VADIPLDGKVRVAYVPAIANLAAPTTTELNAGMLLQLLMTADGLSGFRPDTADVDTSSLASTFNTQTLGRVSFSNMMLRFKKQDGTDTVWNTLTKGTTGFIVLRRYIDQATVWASSQKVQVYPVIVATEADVDPEPNSLGRWESPLKLTLEPVLRAVVA
jgi:hypothetical protein